MKQKKFRLPRLSRRARLARNLFFAAFLVIASWVLAGCPAWTEAGALRQLERTLLLEPGTVRCRGKWGGLWDSPQVLVTGGNYAYTAAIYQSELFWSEVSSPLEYAVLDGGPVLFQWVERGLEGSMEQGTWLCPNPSEGAVGAELTISLDYELDGGLVRQGTRQVQDYETGTAELRAQGSLEDTGLLRLEIAAGDDREAVLLQELFFGSGYETADGGERWRGCTITRADCRLELFDGDGGSMGERPVVWGTER